MLALLVHLTGLAAGCAYAWGQWAAVAVEQEAVQQSRLAIQDLDRRLSDPGGAHPAAPSRADPFLPGQTAATAGANLQDQVVSAVRKAGGTVTSSQVEAATAPAETRSGPPSLLLTVSFELGLTPLQAVLYGLEDGVPALVVDHVSIDAPEAGRGDVLKVSLTVSGFWRGDTKS